MMDAILAAHRALCGALMWLCLRLTLSVHRHEQRTQRRARKLRGSLRRLWRAFLRGRGRLPYVPRRRPPWNRTPSHIEENVVRLHVDQPQLGTGQLMRLAERVLAFRAARETFRQILIRRRDLVIELEDARRRRPRRIRVTQTGHLWGVDLTLVWLLGFWPVWLLGAVDYHGSRVVAFERLAWPTAHAVTRALSRAFDEHGAPERLLTDRGPVFTSAAFADLCAARSVRHVRIRPGHCWTNGRIERVFRTFKQTVFGFLWLFASPREIDRYCADFRRWHNADRPHASYDGRTPDEVYSSRAKQLRPLGRIDYFDGQLHWYRFG
jgi:transposase InsO family protein